MFFDDRLATVLRQRADSDAARRTQFRQLLDILGAEPGGARSARDSSLVANAWMRLGALAETIPAPVRARMIAEPGWRFRNPQLAAHLADCEPEVAASALTRAQLSPSDWATLIPRLPVRARGFLRLRRDLPAQTVALLDRLGVRDLGLPSPALAGNMVPGGNEDGVAPLDDSESGDAESVDEDEDAGAEADADHADDPDAPFILTQEAGREEPHVAPEPPHRPGQPRDRNLESRSEISALVERIARFRRDREHAGEREASEPRLPLGEDTERNRTISAFGFSADAAGRIEWADAEVAAMVIGTRLVAPARLGSASPQTPLERAFARRQPIDGETRMLAGAEAIAGSWIVTAQPRFTHEGNFTGYVGRFRRPVDAGANSPSASEREADRIRQLLHELRTPVTAVQGYAEVIQQQLFGPAPHEYRALAAAIAADAARILSGFEELDRLARLETGMIALEEGETDLAALVARIVSQLSQVLGPRMAGIVFESPPENAALVALDEEGAEALLWRLLATLGGGCASGEMIDAAIETGSGEARLVCDLPAQLLAEEDLFTAEARPVANAINAGLFGAGFSLRLARAEARSAGGALVREGERITLMLPLSARGDQGDRPQDFHAGES
ncbi:histidine kinase dimerization/phospho-acceptor domain-containing protein [Qipengyuania nanhaisediminis]|uniref:histidine kinase dimerization/phospho-acceptor domain-containing protein n=1 Tax=Qipengyuania nanhaisediminis TaxID=604088 RepID=UPI0038B28ECB